jgi:hypothetical protein
MGPNSLSTVNDLWTQAKTQVEICIYLFGTLSSVREPDTSFEWDEYGLCGSYSKKFVHKLEMSCK